MAEQFIHNFCFGVRPQKKTTHLLYVKQAKGESLRDYIARFNKEKLEVEDYEESIAMTALIGGLQKGKLLWKLAEDPLGLWRSCWQPQGK